MRDRMAGEGNQYRTRERRMDELDPFSFCFIKKINTGGERRMEMSWIHVLIVLLEGQYRRQKEREEARR